MAKGSRPEDDTQPRRAKRRRRPPVLELKASKVGGTSGKAESENAKDEREREAPHAAAESGWDRWRTQVTDMNWRKLATTPLVTGALGVVAGALIVFLLMPRDESADSRVGELAGEIANLSARIESLAARPVPVPAPDQSGLGSRIDRLTAAINEAELRLAAVEKRPEPKAPDLSGVHQRTAAMEGTLKELRSGLSDLKRMAEQAPAAASPQAIEGIAGRIGGLEERIAALAAVRAAPPPVKSATAAEFVALNSLTGVVRSGNAYVKELDAARTLLGERAAPLAALEPFAAKGLPSVAALERQFSELVPQLLRGPEADGSFFDRLLTNAGRLVEVRRVGEPEGNSASAIVARAETKLARGDLDGAIAEVEALPESSKAVAANWLAAAKQRRDAEALVAKVLEASLSGSAEHSKP